MNVVVIGGTGFIGRNVAPVLAAHGHVVTIITRNRRKATAVVGSDFHVQEWDALDCGRLENLMKGQDAVVNFAGASLAECRWTPARKAVLRASRIETTRVIVKALSHLPVPVQPKIFLNASGVGFYGLEATNGVDETTGPGNGFLADLCVAWEREAFKATDHGIRTVCLRISMVLGKGGGALQKMLLPFKCFLGGPLGKGTQPVSWIHVDDLGRLVAAILGEPLCKGAVNAASPNPVTMKEFCLQLGRALGRPSWLPVPAWVLTIGLGEMATLMTHGQSVNPRVAQELGFTYKYPTLESAFSAILEKRS